MRNIAVILAGGIGSRVGGETPKQLLPLADGRSILEHSIDAFEASPCIDEIAVVMHPDHISSLQKLCQSNRWQKLTKEYVTPELLDRLSEYADEFLIHAVDVEGQAKGIEEELVAMLGAWCKKKHAEAAASESPGACPAVTYAGGVGGFADLEALARIGGGYVNVTIGSALDLFGGRMDFEEVIRFCQRQRN